MVSFTHGTEVFRGDAPSGQPTGFEPGPAYTYASAGFAVSDPDYLYYASHDEQAVNANIAHCQAWFAAQGLRVAAVNLGTPDYQGSRHYGSNVAGTARIARWFLALSR